jgi:Ohr subfamily peroxiredoxin
MTTLYETQATAIGGRHGAAATADGRWRFNLAIPRELGGDGDEGINPEQLFAIGYAACFLTAIRDVAGEDGIEIAADANVTANVGLGRGEDGLRLKVNLMVDLPGVATDTALDVIRRAHDTCPYSRATRGNIDVKLNLVGYP